MNEKEFIEMSSKLSKNLGIISQYLILLIPFVCKFIVKTLKEITRQKNLSARQNAIKSGFWDEEMELFDQCLDKSKKHRELNNNASCKFTKNQKIYNENDECQAIEEIMNAMNNRKINIRQLKSKESISKLIDKWATDISNSRYEKENIENYNKVLKDPINYFIDNYNFNEKFQSEKVNKTREIILEIINYALKSNGINKYFKSLFSQITNENNLLTTILRDLDENNTESSIYPIEFPFEKFEIGQLNVDNYSENPSFSDHSSFIEKYDLRPCIDLDLHKTNITKFPKLTFKNSRGVFATIPDWEIQKLLEKYIFLPKQKIIDENQLEEMKELKSKMFKRKKVDKFGNLKSVLLQKRNESLKREKRRKTDMSRKIKMKQKSY